MDTTQDPAKQRFVLLRHEMPVAAGRTSHWDLMLENRGSLLTWAFPQLPIAAPPARFESLGIRRLADHRLLYLAFEGAISGNRGYVQREDAGCFTLRPAPLQSTTRPTATELPGGDVCAILTGQRFLIELRLPASAFTTAANESCAGEVLRFERL